MAVHFQPKQYHSVTPYLIVKGAAMAIDFYKKAFGAEEIYRFDGGGGKIGHAEIKIGDSILMIADEHPEMGAISPQTLGGSPISLLVYVPDVDAAFARALQAGGRQERPIEDKFYGDRSGGVEDPFGYKWYLATHKEDVSPEEMERRMAVTKK